MYFPGKTQTNNTFAGMQRTFYPKYVSYFGNGTGRDQAAIMNNGGLTKVNKPGLGHQGVHFTPYAHPQVNNRSPSPQKDATTFYYQSDGTGRDLYVVQDSGGLRPEYDKGHQHSDKLFKSSLRCQTKSPLKYFKDSYRDKADITTYLNWQSQQGRKVNAKHAQIQNRLLKRLTTTNQNTSRSRSRGRMQINFDSQPRGNGSFNRLSPSLLNPINQQKLKSLNIYAENQDSTVMKQQPEIPLEISNDVVEPLVNRSMGFNPQPVTTRSTALDSNIRKNLIDLKKINTPQAQQAARELKQKMKLSQYKNLYMSTEPDQDLLESLKQKNTTQQISKPDLNKGRANSNAIIRPTKRKLMLDVAEPMLPFKIEDKIQLQDPRASMQAHTSWQAKRRNPSRNNNTTQLSSTNKDPENDERMFPECIKRKSSFIDTQKRINKNFFMQQKNQQTYAPTNPAVLMPSFKNQQQQLESVNSNLRSTKNTDGPSQIERERLQQDEVDVLQGQSMDSMVNQKLFQKLSKLHAGGKKSQGSNFQQNVSNINTSQEQGNLKHLQNINDSINQNDSQINRSIDKYYNFNNNNDNGIKKIQLNNAQEKMANPNNDNQIMKLLKQNGFNLQTLKKLQNHRHDNRNKSSMAQKMYSLTTNNTNLQSPHTSSIQVLGQSTAPSLTCQPQTVKHNRSNFVNAPENDILKDQTLDSNQAKQQQAAQKSNQTQHESIMMGGGQITGRVMEATGRIIKSQGRSSQRQTNRIKNLGSISSPHQPRAIQIIQNQ